MKEYTEDISLSSSTEQLTETPFPDKGNFFKRMESAEELESLPSWSRPESPFRSIYELEGQEDMDDPVAEEFAEFLTDLYYEDFNGVLFELMNEASDFYNSQLEVGYGSPIEQEAQAERMLKEYFAPLNQEIERLIDNMNQALVDADLESMSEAEVEKLLDQVELDYQFSPEHEHLFGLGKKFKGWVTKKAKNLVKKGIELAKKAGGPLIKRYLNKLKGIVNELLIKVLNKAINKLPSSLRPVATALRKKYLKFELEEDEGNYEFEELLDQNVAKIQHEFDLQVANLLFAPDETEEEAAISAYVSESNQMIENPINQLDRARAQFISEILEIEEEEDLAQRVENFAPAIIAAAKLAIKFMGRDKVVRSLAKPISRLIKRFIPRKFRKYRWPLSKALVDVGLRSLKLEVAPEEEAETAASAVASVVEDTIRDIANLPEYILDDEQLLESHVVDAFEQAAAKNFPHVLPENVYIRRPDLRETCRINGAWVMLPLRGKKYYKKYTRVFDTTICPHAAEVITTFGGISLATYLRDQYSLSAGSGIKARVHLYQAIPGSRLSQISKYESSVSGLGTTDGWSRFHPLTPEAAGLLIGETGLGRYVSAPYLAHRRMIDDNGGQRFYYLEIDGAHPQMNMTTDGIPALRGSTEVNVTLNFTHNQLKSCIFLSESDAQELAVKLRQQAPIGSVLKYVLSAMETGLKMAFSPGMYHRIKIVHPAVTPGRSQNKALKTLGPIVAEKLIERIMQWTGKTLADYFKNKAQEFITAANDEEDGVTLAIMINNPNGLSNIRKLLSGGAVALRGQWFPEGKPDVNIKIYAGFHRE
jgi:hypothetical protein